ncbi:mitochondrial glycoprotein [Xylariomycetidae sp. FL0641]|nr:mitochondrial glycoprotein [Xylariomycetidae sp. FL0641]
MMSLRVAARSAPRTLTRLSANAVRQSTVARSSSLVKSSWAPLRASQSVSAFSTTPLRKAASSEVDEELSAKLETELQFEGEIKDSDSSQNPASVQDFLENTPFELKDTPGHEEVFLTRKFGNENITVSFSISDLSNYEPDMYNEDSALSDEELDSPEGKQLSEQEAEDGVNEAEPAVPCRLNIVVEKPGKGALNIEAVAQDGAIMVENFYYFKDPNMAHGKNPEIVHKAEETYPGPPFGSLDEDLQVLMERYLEERGITQAFAIFVPDYMDMKEQREYQAWLKNVKGFIDA